MENGKRAGARLGSAAPMPTRVRGERRTRPSERSDPHSFEAAGNKARRLRLGSGEHPRKGRLSASKDRDLRRGRLQLSLGRGRYTWPGKAIPHKGLVKPIRPCGPKETRKATPTHGKSRGEGTRQHKTGKHKPTRHGHNGKWASQLGEQAH